MTASSGFTCPTCDYRSAKWMGFCPQCGSTEPLVENRESTKKRGRTATSTPIAEARSQRSESRLATGWLEVDRVLGGGLVTGSVVLLGGEPGVGKSTLLLQLASGLGGRGATVLVASAEESVQQVAMRAERLGASAQGVELVSDDDVDAIVNLAEQLRPEVLVVDSIQTVGVGEIPSAPGGVSQVRESAARLIRLAKVSGTAVILVGHVTKEGGLAGPKTLEHMVDVVLYLEGDPDRGLRVLRSHKNRFGATHVSGMFDMRSDGLVEVDDPSKMFLDGWEPGVPGTVVFPAVEGRRSVLVEVQALVAPSHHSQPRRSIRGLDPARVNQVLAVLHKHAGIGLADMEVYVNVVGGWRIDDPGCDLPLALAVASSALNVPLGRLAAWGEIGLTGEVRAIPFEARRLEEVARMGLDNQIAPGGGTPMKLVEVLEQAGIGSSAP